MIIFISSFFMLEYHRLGRREIWLLLVGLAFVTFPWSERINSFFILLIVLLFLLDKNLLVKCKNFKKNLKKIVPFFFFFLLHFFFIRFSNIENISLQTIEVKLSFLILPIVFAGENFWDKKNIHFIFKFFAFSLLLSVLFCVYQYYIIYYPVEQWSKIFKRMYFSRIMHPGYFSNFFMIAFIYFSLSLFEEKNLSHFDKKLFLFFCIIFLCVLLILASKTALIVLFLFFLFLLWKKIATRFKSYLKYVLLFLSPLVLLLFFLFTPGIRNRVLETQNELTEISSDVDFDNSTGSRLAAWGVEWDLIKQNSWKGYGTGNANDILLNELRNKNYADLVENKMHTHQQFFHTWLELGLLGLVSLLALFAFLFYYFIKNKIEMGTWATLLLFVYCLTDDALEIQAILVFFILLITLYLFQPASYQHKNKLF